MTDTTKQAEPVAWINNSALRTLKIGLTDFATVSPQETQTLTNALYLHPAPVLTAELKAELLEAFKIAEYYLRYTQCPELIFVFLGAAITKLTNLECGS